MDALEASINNNCFDYFRSFSYEQLAVLRDLAEGNISLEEANALLLDLNNKKQE